MTPLFYSRRAYCALAALPKPAQAVVRDAVSGLTGAGDASASLRALPGGLEHDLVQVAVEGVGRLVCRMTADRIDVLMIVQRNHALPTSARRLAAGSAA